MAERMSIGCPQCQANVEYIAGSHQACCPVCGRIFDPEGESERLRATVTSRSSDIRMTGEIAPDALVWKHPQTLFPLSARIIAKAGMTAVVVQGDQQVFAVNGQSVLLSETSLRADACSYGPAGDKLVYAEVYYVRNSIPQAVFAWGGRASLVGSYNDMHAFALNGTCQLAPIVDHAAFLRFVNFDCGVRASAFALRRDESGVETAGGYARSIVRAMRAVYGEALRRVRDRMGLMPSMLGSCAEEIACEVERLAGRELAGWGLAVERVVAGDVKYLGIDVHGDPLRLRVEGALDWSAGEIRVHQKGAPEIYAQLRLSGSLYIAVTDEDRLRQATAAVRWSMGDADGARRELAAHAGSLLGSMFASVFQNLIEDLNPPLDMLGTYAGYLRAQAEKLLNEPSELLSRHGLCAQQLTLQVEVAGKSPLYALREREALAVSEAGLRERLQAYAPKGCPGAAAGQQSGDMTPEMENAALRRMLAYLIGRNAMMLTQTTAQELLTAADVSTGSGLARWLTAQLPGEPASPFSGAQGMRRCMFCQHDIPVHAVLCPHCGHF